MKGICFAGGGIKAAAHIGVLKAFEEDGIEFECVSGASSGSIIATMYALGYNSDEMLVMFQEFASKIKYYQWGQILKLIGGLIFKREIIIDGGVRENLPWRHLKLIGADEVWGITFNTISNKEDCCSNIIEAASRALELQGRELAIYETEGIDKLININMKKVALLDAKKAEYLYHIGYINTKKQIQNYALH